MTKRTSVAGTIVGLAVITLVAVCGADGLWGQYSLPPVILSAIAAVVVQWIAFGFAWNLKSERFFDLLGSATFALVVVAVVVVVAAMAVCSPVNSSSRRARCTFVSELPRSRICI